MFRFQNRENAENFRASAFDNTQTSLMVVVHEGIYLVCSRKEASKLIRKYNCDCF